MEEIDHLLDFFSLPESRRHQVYNIIKPNFIYFSSDMPIRLEVINKISNEKVRLIALKDLKNETQQLLESYIKTYHNYINGLEESHLSSKYFGNSTCQIEGTPIAGSLSYDKDVITLSIEYNEFSASETAFTIKLQALEETIKTLCIKLEIEEKYKIKKKSEIKSPLPPIKDVNELFANLFESDEIAQEFIKLLIKYEYITDDEKWRRKSKRPGELRDAYLALEKLGLLKPELDALDAIRIFYSRFGMIVYKEGEKGTISERACRVDEDDKRTKNYDKFLVILNPLVLFKK